MNFSALQLFQFENLMQTRSNFCFFNMAEDLRPWFGPLERMHFDRVEVRCDVGAIEAHLIDQKIPKEYAILLLCPDGTVSEEKQKSLESLGYKNVYYIAGGASGLRKEKSVGKST
jgi:rhodanese-related sulfurtransferase